MSSIGILGGGITGLALGWFLKKRFGEDVAITIIEKQQHLGGWVRSLTVDGFLFELGPRSCRVKTGAATLELVRQLGLERELITASSAAHKRHLFIDNTLQALPSGPLSLFVSPLMRGVLPALWREKNVPPGNDLDESIEDFFCRRFGRYITETFVDPLVSGIYAGDIRQLSMKSCFPKIVNWEQRYGSVFKGAWATRKEEQDPLVRQLRRKGLFSFKNGMETLVKALAGQLDARILCGKGASAVTGDSNGVTVTMGNKTLQFDEVFSTVPAYSLAYLLRSACPEITRVIADMRWTSMAVVNVAYRQSVSKKRGFGYLIPSKEKENILGCVWNASTFPEQQPLGGSCFSVMIGGEHMANFEEYSEEQFKDIALAALKTQMNIAVTPDVVHVASAKKSISQYIIGHDARVQYLRERVAEHVPRLKVVGSSYDGIAVNDCVTQAQIAASQRFA